MMHAHSIIYHLDLDENLSVYAVMFLPFIQGQMLCRICILRLTLSILHWKT